MKKAYQVEFAPDSRLLAVAQTSTTSGAVRVFRFGYPNPTEFPVLKNLRRMGFSDDGQSLIVCNHDGWIECYDTASGSVRWKSAKFKCEFRRLAVYGDVGLVVASGLPERRLALLELASGRDAGSLMFGDAWCPSEFVRLGGSHDLFVHLVEPGASLSYARVDLQTRKIMMQTPRRPMIRDYIIQAMVGANHSDLTLVSCGGTLFEVDLDSGNRSPWHHIEGSRDYLFSPDDRLLAVLGYEEWQLVDVSERKAILSRSEPADRIHFSPDGQWLARAWREQMTIYRMNDLLPA